MSQIGVLNNALRVRGKLNSVICHVKFLRQCLSSCVAPKGIQARVRKAKVYHSVKIEKAFLRDEIGKVQLSLDSLRRTFSQELRRIQTFLTPCDFVRFARLIGE